MAGRDRSEASGARLGRGLLVAACFSLAVAPPAQAYQLGDIIRGAAGAVSGRMPGQKPPPTTPGVNPGAPGAMGLQATTPTAPLHKLGTDAVAVVDAASGTTAVRQMDYVFAKQTINVGPKGAITLSYLSGCLTEVIAGGVVTVEPTGSRVTGGRLQTRATPGCRSATPVILASASEAGATVNRITPFTGVDWNERALKSALPVFKWDMALGPVTIRVKNMDQAGDPVVWTGASSADWVAYPVAGAKLVTGAPFKVEAVAGEKVVASALFSIDPTLDVADNMANRVVPLSAP